jgi:hypothetical protein
VGDLQEVIPELIRALRESDDQGEIYG